MLAKVFALISARDENTPRKSRKRCDIYLGHRMRKPTICIGGSREADQRLCFRYSDSTIPTLLICKISGF